MALRALPLLLLAGFLSTSPTVAEQRRPAVAAAANLSGALTEMADAFARDGGGRIELVFGASGALTRQILDGAPFELFLAADESYPQRLVDAGLTRGDGVVYALGRLAIYAPTDSPLAVDGDLEGLAAWIRSGAPGRFAMANPDVAPYGSAARDVLRAAGLWNDLQPRLVFGENVTQAARFATTGNAVGGLVAYSLALSPDLADRGRHAVIPDTRHEPLRQRMVLLRSAGPTAAAFYNYLQADTARAIFERHGYDVPGL